MRPVIIPGLVSVTFREKKPEEIIALCVQNSLCGVEWGENSHIMPGDPEGAAALRKKTLDAGLKVVAYGSYYRLCTGMDFKPTLVSAKALGAPVIRVWAGNIPSEEADEDYRSNAAGEAALIAGQAEKEGIKIAFEWHKNTLTDTNESAVDLLKHANHPNLYCLWQPTAALNMEQRCEGIRLLGDRLLNLHTYYWPDGKREEFAPGKGEWKQYLSYVPKDRDRYALLEFVKDNTVEQLEKDAKALIELLTEEGVYRHG